MKLNMFYAVHVKLIVEHKRISADVTILITVVRLVTRAAVAGK